MMPRKAVSEMNAFERIHYSLGGRTFRAIVLISLVISIAAASFGFLLFSTSINREYRTNTARIAKAATTVVSMEEVLRAAKTIVPSYDALPEQTRHDDPNALTELFSGMKTGSYQQMCATLRHFQVENEAIAAYVAAADLQNNRLVILADADSGENAMQPSYMIELTQREMDIYLNGAEPSLWDTFFTTDKIPAMVIRGENGTFRCTASARLMNYGSYPLLLFFDTDMNRAADAGKSFLAQYAALLLIVSLLTLVVGLIHLRKTVVNPINQLTEAATAYTQARNDTHRDGKFFSNLNIRTGDEIENLAYTMKLLESDLAKYVQNLTSVTAERERISTELSLATKIQASMLPSVFPPFPEREDMDIFASMKPAKEVGGDFYDFFLVDDSHLALVMADVSGKGIPAALFMMITKILVQNHTMTGLTPTQVLETLNRQICKNNPQEMFVTVWLGILDLKTGVLTAANAGHEYPILKQPDGSFEIIKDRHGFVIGGMDGSRYPQYELQLKPGAKLFLYTDGVMEATNAEREQFGAERLLASLKRAENESPQAILTAISHDLEAFADGAPQFDDVTMLCLDYGGEKDMNELTIEATVENIATVTDFVDSALDKLDCSMKIQTQINIAIDELFGNIARYAYNPETGPATVRVEVEQDPLAVLITFIDNGKPYDPLSAQDPDITASAEDREIGGLGVFLVKKTMDDVTYEYKNGQNVLRIRKKVSP